MANFAIEVNVRRYANSEEQNAAIHTTFMCNSIIEFTEYMSAALEHFKAMVRFTDAVESVGILVRAYNDHHTVFISRDAYGLKVTTNQK